MNRLSNKQKLILILVIAAVALLLQYVFHEPLLPRSWSPWSGPWWH